MHDHAIPSRTEPRPHPFRAATARESARPRICRNARSRDPLPHRAATTPAPSRDRKVCSAGRPIISTKHHPPRGGTFVSAVLQRLMRGAGGGGACCARRKRGTRSPTRSRTQTPSRRPSPGYSTPQGSAQIQPRSRRQGSKYASTSVLRIATGVPAPEPPRNRKPQRPEEVARAYPPAIS